MIKIFKSATLFCLLSIFLFSCSNNNKINDFLKNKNLETTQQQLITLLNDESLSSQSRYAVIKRIANLYSTKNSNQMVLFLTDWVEKHPTDIYNAYWLLMVASNYLKNQAEPIAEYYFDRILKNYPDLLIQGESIHFICLQHLIQISKNPTNRISYFNQLVSRFPSLVSITEMYVRLALEYEKEGEWKQALKSYSLCSFFRSTSLSPGKKYIPEFFSYNSLAAASMANTISLPHTYPASSTAFVK